MKDIDKCKRCARRTSVLGLSISVLLAVFKLTVGYMGRSRALVASGMWTLSDILSSLLVFLGIRYSRKDPNRRYPYGYGKIEFVAQIGISVLMIVGTVALLVSSLIVIATRSIVIPHWVVFFTAILCATSNGLIYKFASCAARKLNSPALRSHAEHNKSDVASSLLVATGVIATRAGIHWADPLIAIFDCACVIHGSCVIFWDGLKGIMDTSLPENFNEEIRRRALEIADIREVTKVLARQSGERIFLDVTLALDPDLPVWESKRVIQALKANLRRNDKYLTNISVQIVPAE